MGRSNSANGGSSYYDLDIQVVATSDTQYTLRAVIYLTSLNVSDSVNNLSVGGNWSRGGALALGGVYNHAPVWFQDITFNRIVGQDVGVSVSASWSNVEYWGTTLSASASYVIPAAPNPVSPPGPPVFAYNTSTQNMLYLGATPGPSNGSGIDLNHLRVWTDGYSYHNPNIFAQNVSGWDWQIMAVPNQMYYWGVQSRNSAGWSAPSNETTGWWIASQPSGYVKVGGAWRPAAGYANVGGTWRTIVQTYVNVGGVWRTW